MAKRTPKPKDDTAPKEVRDPRWVNNEFWFKASLGPEAKVHEKVVTYGKALRDLYSTAHRIDRVHERLYEGFELKRYPGALAALRQHGFSAARLNVSKAVVNTVVSRQSKSRAMPSVVVNDATWEYKRKAKQFRKFIVGEMLETEFDERSRECLRDGGVVGTGITRIDDSGDGERVFAERILRDELLFDPRECKYGKPFQAIHVHRIARAHLAEKYPQFSKQIFDASPAAWRPSDDLDDDASRNQSLDDYVDVFEAWARGQRHALCIDNATLLFEEWDCPRLPFALYRYAKPMRGIWGKGLIYELKDIQHRINCIVRDMQMNLQATGRGYYAIHEGAAVPTEMMTGWAPFAVKYKGNSPPVFTAPTPINPAQLEMLRFFMQQAFELPGVSQAAASSKPSLGPGASGVALDTQYDIESERFAMEEAQYAEYRLQAGQLYIDASKRCAKKRAELKKPKYVSAWFSRDAIDKLEYDNVAMEDKDLRLQLEPVSFIPQTRAGKLSAVGQLAQAGVIPQWLSAALFDEPDLERANKITLSAFWNAEKKMDVLADPSKPMPACAPYNDLDLELRMVVAYLNYSEYEGAPSEVMERYLAYQSDVEDKIKLKKQGEAAAVASSAPLPAVAPPVDAGMVPGVGQVVPPMSGGAMPPAMMPPLAA